MVARLVVLVLSVALSACGSDAAGDGAGGAADAGPGGGNSNDAGPGGGGNDGGGDPGPEPVRFVVIGDTGEGNEAQYEVADAIEAKCAAAGCDFVLLLGDNIYNSGVTSVDDPQWQDKFELPYEDLDMPFWAVLGNHDYGGSLFGFEAGGVGNEWDKGPIEVMYSDVSNKFTMPNTFYTFTWGNVGFIMLDTNSIMWANNDNGDQRAWYATALMEVQDAEWVFAAGHHPYLSNGQHGNAGAYDGLEGIGNPLPLLNGNLVKSFMEDLVCGTVDIYFAGHDHNREWLDENDKFCGAELIISGAGAKLRELPGRGNAYHWQDNTVEGFLWVEVVGNRLTGQFIDKHGNLEFERTITR